MAVLLVNNLFVFASVINTTPIGLSKKAIYWLTGEFQAQHFK